MDLKLLLTQQQTSLEQLKQSIGRMRKGAGEENRDNSPGGTAFDQEDLEASFDEVQQNSSV